jgi:type IV secretory pathway VirJ component
MPTPPPVIVGQAAALLPQHDMLVVGVDTAGYAETLAGVTEACHQLVAAAETISRQLQRERRSSAYFTTIMAGVGQGGTLAEQVLAEAPSDTIAGAASIDPVPTLDLRFKRCPPDPAKMRGPGLPAAIQARVSAPSSTIARTRRTIAPSRRPESACRNSRKLNPCDLNCPRHPPPPSNRPWRIANPIPPAEAEQRYYGRLEQPKIAA